MEIRLIGVIMGYSKEYLNHELMARITLPRPASDGRKSCRAKRRTDRPKYGECACTDGEQWVPFWQWWDKLFCANGRREIRRKRIVHLYEQNFIL